MGQGGGIFVDTRGLDLLGVFLSWGIVPTEGNPPPMKQIDGSTLGEKHEALLWLLESSMVQLVVNTTHEGVDLPAHLLTNPGLRVNVSNRFAYGVDVDEQEVRSRLSFNGADHDCKIPFDAVWALIPNVGNEIYVWADDQPVQRDLDRARELERDRVESQQKQARKASKAVVEAKRDGKSWLRVVKDG